MNTVFYHKSALVSGECGLYVQNEGARWQHDSSLSRPSYVAKHDAVVWIEREMGMALEWIVTSELE